MQQRVGQVQQRVAAQRPPAELGLLPLRAQPFEVIRHRRVGRIGRAEAASPARGPGPELADLGF
eukprot:536984-Pyramimonas_sp.AAC.1